MSSSFILTDVDIFDGEEALGQGYIQVVNGKIGEVTVGHPPAGLAKSHTVISRPGHTVLPGFVDAHNHVYRDDPAALRQALAFGVTTLMEMHNENENIIKLKAYAAQHQDLSADIKAAGVAATIENGWPVPVITAHDKSPETMAEIARYPRLKTAEDAKAYVKNNVAIGADYIKLMHESGEALGAHFTKPTTELQASIIKEAHEAGRVAVAHALSLKDHMEMLECGIDGMTHAFYDQQPTPEIIEAYKQNNAWLNPTLAAIGSLTLEGQADAEKFAHDKRVNNLLDDEAKSRMCKCMGFHAETSKLEYAYELVRQLHKAGVDVIVGSDAAKPALGTSWGLSFHHEISLFVNQCGFAPVEALRAGTSLVAKRFGFSDRGRLAKGLNADLVLCKGKPHENIGDTLNLAAVWRNGVLAKRFQEEAKVGSDGGLKEITNGFSEKTRLHVQVDSVAADDN